jgi:hypothetical protein
VLHIFSIIALWSILYSCGGMLNGLSSFRRKSIWVTFSGSMHVRFMSRVNEILAVEKDRRGETLLLKDNVKPLQKGQILLKVQNFAVTANTVTYATVGEKFGYWDFHKNIHEIGSQSKYGFVPAIGWATVEESSNDDIPVGGKYFGWYPMAKYVTVSAEARSSGFRDVGSHRCNHAPVYVDFTRSDTDPYYCDSSADGEDRQALLRGLFLTSFLANEYLLDANYYQVRTYVSATCILYTL